MRLARVGRTVKTMTAKPAPRRTAASRLRQVDLAQHSPDAFVSKNGTGKHNVRHCLVSDDHRHRDKPPRRLLASQMGGELTTTAKKSSGIGQIPLINSANAHMAQLALDPNVPFSLSLPRWSGVADLAATTLEGARPGYNRIALAGLPALTDGVEAVIVTHPLWSTGPTDLGADLTAAWNEAEQVHGLQIDVQRSFISVFEALRRPA